MSGDRFARQNPYGPPPEFPLASTGAAIVHHLSGPSIHALTQIFQKNPDRSMMLTASYTAISPQATEPPFTFITRGGLPPLHSHVCWTP